MLRQFDAVPAPGARLLRIVAAGAAALAIAGCGIKGPLRLPSAPPATVPGTASTPQTSSAPNPDPGAIAPDATPRR